MPMALNKTAPAAGQNRFLRPGEVAVLFRVDPKTPGRWAADGKLKAIRTPGGHRLFPARLIFKLIRPERGPLMTPAEAAELFRVDRDTLLKWVADGRIDCVRMPGGGHYRFNTKDVEELLALEDHDGGSLP